MMESGFCEDNQVRVKLEAKVDDTIDSPPQGILNICKISEIPELYYQDEEYSTREKDAEGTSENPRFPGVTVKIEVETVEDADSMPQERVSLVKEKQSDRVILIGHDVHLHEEDEFNENIADSSDGERTMQDASRVDSSIEQFAIHGSPEDEENLEANISLYEGWLPPATSRIVAKAASKQGSCCNGDEVSSDVGMTLSPVVQDHLHLTSDASEIASTGKVEVLTSRNEYDQIGNKRQYCVFCLAPKAKLSRHLRVMHSDEKEVQEAYSFDKNSPERRALLAVLTNKGNHAHNVQALKDGHGTLIPRRRPTNYEPAEKYLPCESCFGYFVASEMWKHSKKCPVKIAITGRNRGLLAGCPMLLPIAAKEGDDFKENVFGVMRCDKVGMICRNDQLISNLGQRLYCKLGTESHNVHLVSQKMREMGRLMMVIQEGNPGVMRLDRCIQPSFFHKVVEAVRVCTGYDPKTQKYKTPSLALTMGNSLKKCAEIQEAAGNSSGDAAMRDCAEKFKQLCDAEYAGRVLSNAPSTLHGRKNVKIPGPCTSVAEDDGEEYDASHNASTNGFSEVVVKVELETAEGVGSIPQNMVPPAKEEQSNRVILSGHDLPLHEEDELYEQNIANSSTSERTLQDSSRVDSSTENLEIHSSLEDEENFHLEANSSDEKWLPLATSKIEAGSPKRYGNEGGGVENASSESEYNAGSSLTKVTVLSHKDRKWKHRYCIFCLEPKTKLSKHLRYVHSDEPEVQEAFSFDSNSPERRALLAVLTNKGNHVHNVTVLKDGHGTLIPRRRPQNNESAEKYLPCERCFGYYLASDMLRHSERCLVKQSLPMMNTCLQEDQQIYKINTDGHDRQRSMQEVSGGDLSKGYPDVLGFPEDEDSKESESDYSSDEGWLPTTTKKNVIMAASEQGSRCGGDVEVSSNLGYSEDEWMPSTVRTSLCKRNHPLKQQLCQIPSPSRGIYESSVQGNIHLTTNASEIASAGKVEVLTSRNEYDQIGNKHQYCKFCLAPKAKLSRHLRVMHSDEKEVQEAYSFDKNSPERRALLAVLTNKGNHAHNVQALKDGHGTLVPRRRPTNYEPAEKYLPCERCFGYFVASEMWKHSKKCPVKIAVTGRNRGLLARCSMLLPITAKVDDDFKENVFGVMRCDKVGMICRNDQLISNLGQQLYFLLGTESHNVHHISQKMREMGRFMMVIQEGNPGVMRLDQCIQPSFFHKVVEAVSVCAGYDPKTQKYKTPSLALTMGNSLKKCAEIQEAAGIRSENVAMRDCSVSFKQLCDTEWADHISSDVLSTLRERKRVKPVRLQLPVNGKKPPEVNEPSTAIISTIDGEHLRRWEEPQCPPNNVMIQRAKRQRVKKRKGPGRSLWSMEESQGIASFFEKHIKSGRIPRKRECDACQRKLAPVLNDRTWQNIKYKVYNIVQAQRRMQTY